LFLILSHHYVVMT